MKVFISFISLILPMFLYAVSLKELLHEVDKNPLLKAKNFSIKAKHFLVENAKSQDSIKIDLDIKSIRLQETPMATFYIPQMPPFDVPVGTKNNVIGAINFSYPIFSGFAIEANIQKAKLNLIKEKLKKADLKRRLYLKVIELYTAIYSINEAIKAAQAAKIAMNDSLKVARGMYENDLLGVSKLYNIEAKKYQVDARLKDLLSKKEILKENLYYITGKKVDKAFLKDVKISLDEKKLIKLALKNREDIKIIKKDLNILDKDIKMINSRYYPKVALVGSIKRESDDFSFGKNGYTNPNKSFVGVSFKWDLYDGSFTKSKKEALKAKKEATLFYLKDYENRVKSDIKQNIWSIKSLYSLLKAANKEILAQRKYLKLTKAKFKNSLVSSDELSRAILSFYKAVAKKEDIKSKIFFLKNKLKLQTGLKNFSN